MNFWEKVCDEMLRISDNDPELCEALYHINERCKVTKEKFSDAVFKIIYGDKNFKN